ncbi:MAG: pyridoxal phosphate-dependent aminotransferase [Acidaminococcales bacterium]|jgi:cystathionine beta-lyase|nr:pyridoxal phosphate-dependent aminotransferase [Acidaminococcales bacterium]
MYNDFDELLNRKGTGCLKWDGCAARFPGLDTSGALPMWVADADFRAPQEVVERLTQMAGFGIYGYPAPLREEFAGALKSWLQRRHALEIEKDWVIFSPGVVPSINIAIQTFTDENDGIIIQPPVYYPFKRSIEANRRKPISNPLVYRGGRYYMDFADLAAKAADKNNKMLILCSPHNPVGRVWEESELRCLRAICDQSGVLLFADEIHSDIVFTGHTHLPALSLGTGKIATAFSMSKTFNLAGLHASAVVVPDASLRQKFRGWLQRASMESGCSFGVQAFIFACQYGEPYLAKMLAYIEGNIAFAREFTKKNIPRARFVNTEGTYLAWLDFNGFGLSPDEIDKTIVEKAKVLGDLGRWFGEGGAGFVRLNFACPRAIVKQALENLQKAFQN